MVRPLGCDAVFAKLRTEIRAAIKDEDMARQSRLHKAIKAAGATCAPETAAEIRAEVCARYEAVTANATVVAMDSYESFRTFLIPVMSAHADVALTAAECKVGEPFDLLTSKFAQFIDFLEARIPKLDFADDFLKFRLGEVMEYYAYCQLLPIVEFCSRFSQDLIPALLTLARQAAYDDCLKSGTALALSELYRFGGEQKGSFAGTFIDVDTFTFDDIEQDIAYCTNSTLDIRAFDEVPVQIDTEGGLLESRGALGAPITTTTVTVPRAGSLTIGGAVRLLVCPDGSLSPDALVFRIGATEIARRAPNGNVFVLNTKPVDLVLSRDLPAAGLDPATITSFTLEIFREGPGCQGLFTEELKLFTVAVNVSVVGAQEFAGSFTLSHSDTLTEKETEDDGSWTCFGETLTLCTIAQSASAQATFSVSLVLDKLAPVVTVAALAGKAAVSITVCGRLRTIVSSVFSGGSPFGTVQTRAVNTGGFTPLPTDADLRIALFCAAVQTSLGPDQTTNELCHPPVTSVNEDHTIRFDVELVGEPAGAAVPTRYRLLAPLNHLGVRTGTVTGTLERLGP